MKSFYVFMFCLLILYPFCLEPRLFSQVIGQGCVWGGALKKICTNFIILSAFNNTFHVLRVFILKKTILERTYFGFSSLVYSGFSQFVFHFPNLFSLFSNIFLSLFLPHISLCIFHCLYLFSF